MTDKTNLPSAVIILGAGSAIAEALARQLAERGVKLGLVARDLGRLDAITADLRVRGAPVVATRVWDLAVQPPTGGLADLSQEIGGADVVLIAYGLLGEQVQAETDGAAAAALLQVNFTSAVLWALEASRVLAAGGRRGLIVALGSVAGDRGRKSNFVYGAAKGGLAIALQGLAHRSGLTNAPRAMVVKLGFVDTPMTSGFKKGGPLWSSPDQAAAAIARAIDRPRAIVYAPWFWRWIALVVRLLPEVIFKNINF